MAVTKIIPIRTTIQKSVDYICNPDKTDGSLLVYSEHCFPQTAGLTFQHHLTSFRFQKTPNTPNKTLKHIHVKEVASHNTRY